ncbi:RnfABCDGE type electron transport complex subunit D [Desulfovibrio aminophilus]|nr:RnfABCDGE type electron transport complex subunit D [Desulfovibrio aminophilus]MCM0756347.1 RnfABCDGE type electron transport complex subunit D [Desulfovibrio aminophilus]
MAALVVKPHAITQIRLTVGPPSHWRCGRTLGSLMALSCLALLPALGMGVWRYGLDAARVAALAGAVAVISEILLEKLAGREVDVDNGTALFHGLLLAMLLPATAPWWLVVAGGFCTIALGRTVFGGFGSNPFCPPLIGWAVCEVSWPKYMDLDLMLAHWPTPDPLAQLKYLGAAAVDHLPLADLFLGNQLGALGAAQGAALLAGGLFLIASGRLRPHIPLAFLTGVAAMAAVFHGLDPLAQAGPLFHLCTGSVLLGAFFLAPDPGSSPSGHWAMLLYGFLAGVLVLVIRQWGIYPDGAPFAILLANLLAPLLDRIRPKFFGGRRHA